jgi:aminoglycoside phosphotransferase (APT) family kinase protein
VTGAPFYVMSFVDGVVLDGPDKAVLLSEEGRRSAAFDLIDVLAELHLLDIDAIGLGDLAKRTGYVERQLRRWSTQWKDSKTRELPAIEEVEARLRADLPVQQAVAIAHGDYRFGNCLTDPTRGRIAAVLDWELCTLGDPLADVGYLRVFWADPVEGGGPAGGRHNDPTPAGGFPSYDELVERYARRTAFDLSGIDYYVAFSSWRLAVISEGVYARYLHGAMADDGVDLGTFKQATEELAEGALAAVHRLGH